MAHRCVRCMHKGEDRVCPVCGWPGSGENSIHQLPVGTVLRDRYQIGKVLGQGGFGITYLAWDLLMDKQVAVKEFFPGGTVFRRSNISTAVECITEEAVPHYDYSKERFLREARALVQFKDVPEVVDILDFISENNTSYIVMEYVRGVDLAKYIQMKGGKLSPEETFRILKPVMEALAKVHKGGIVHRDISPDNIILDPMGGAKLLDFGAVRAVEDPDVDKGLSKSTEAILKQGFAPLEQYNSRGSLGPWTDEYAMCATVWYCLTGTVPVEASIRMTEGIDPDWSTIPGLPEHQRRALEKGFSCRAKDRFESMDALLAALFPKAEKAAPPVELPKAEVPQEAETPKKAVKQPKERKSRGKKKPLIFAMAAAAVLLVFIAAVVLLPGKQESDSPAQLQETPGALPSEAPGQTVPSIPETTPETVPPTEPLSEEERNYLQAEQLLAEGKLGEAAIAFGKLAGFSDARERSFEIWDKIAVRETVSAGTCHSIGLKNDGTVVTTGWDEFDQHDVDDWVDIVAVSNGCWHTVGLKADGTVIAMGYNDSGQCEVTGWTDIVAISAGDWHTLGLKIDGTVVSAGGYNVENWTDIVAISGGREHCLGLKVDGTVVAASDGEKVQCEVDRWTNIVSISAGNYYSLGLKADGTAVTTEHGYPYDQYGHYVDYALCDVAQWSNITAICGGTDCTLGLKADGTVVSAGADPADQRDIAGWTDIVAVSVGWDHVLGLKADGTMTAAGMNDVGQCGVCKPYSYFEWTDIRIPHRTPWYSHGNDPAETTPPEEDGANAEAYANAEKLLAEGKLGEAAIAFGKLAGYSDARERSLAIWEKIAVRDTISTIHFHTVGLRVDGTVIATGLNENGQCDLSNWSNINAIAAGGSHTLGLKTDGTVIAAGSAENGRCAVDGWTDIVSICAGLDHSVGLKIDGTVVATGNNSLQQCDVEGWTDIVAIIAGGEHTVGLKADGTVVATGNNEDGQCVVEQWTDIIAVSAGRYHTVGLKADGTAVAVGMNDVGPNYSKGGRTDVGEWAGLKAVSGGGWFTVGLTEEGNILLKGDLRDGRTDANYWLNIADISAGDHHIVGLRPDGKVWAAGWNYCGCCNVSIWKDILVCEKPVPFR